MLIVNNGVPKSGSTWVQKIIKICASPLSPSEEWRKSITNGAIKDDKIDLYCKQNNEWRDANILIKHHLPDSDYSFVSDPQVRVLVSCRDLAESVVSWFHHCLRNGKANEDSKLEWLENRGRNFVVRAIRHRQASSSAPNTLMIRYEDLLSNPWAKTEEIVSFIGVHPTESLVKRIIKRTSVEPIQDLSQRQGMHIRTAGRRVAQNELPDQYYAEVQYLQTVLEEGNLKQKDLKQFRTNRLIH
jgi:hypothetical protein